MQRVVDRAQIGIDLFAHVAGQKAQSLARLDGGTREDEPLDRALFHQLHGVTDGEPGLASAGRAGAEHQFITLHRAQILVLRGVAGAHQPAFAGDDLLEGAARRFGVGEEAALTRGFLDRAVDVAERDRLALGDPLVKRLQHAAGVLARFRLALQRDVIAIGEGGDLQPPFDLGEVLVVMTKDQGSISVVFEGQGDFRVGFGRLIRASGPQVVNRGQAFASSPLPSSRPASELEPAATMATGATPPIMSAGPLTCTACI